MLAAVLLPDVQSSRSAARALTARAMLAAGEGRFEDARRDLLASHRLARLVGQNPFLIGRLVAIAIDAVTHSADRGLALADEVTAEELERFRKDVQALPSLPPMREAIDVGERFMFLDSVTHIAVGGPDALDMLAAGAAEPDGWQKTVFKMTTGELIDWNEILRRGNRFYDRLAKTFDEPNFAERQQAFEAIEQQLKQKRQQAQGANLIGQVLGKGLSQVATDAIHDVMMALLMPAVAQVDVAETRAKAHRELTLTALALGAYRREHGKYPESPAALSPKYFEQVPGDPFIGKPLHYRRTEDGYLLYSVGPNRKDDGGVMDFRVSPVQDDPSVQVPRPKETE
jgi:hypothetical protein